MSQFVEVTFNDEDPIVVAAVPRPGNKEAFDITGTVDHALRQRNISHPGRENEDDPETFTVTVKRAILDPEDIAERQAVGTPAPARNAAQDAPVAPTNDNVGDSTDETPASEPKDREEQARPTPPDTTSPKQKRAETGAVLPEKKPRNKRARGTARKSDPSRQPRRAGTPKKSE